MWTLFIFESICSKVTLAKSGLKVTVLEKRSILGGRARSWIDGVTRDPVHIGPHVVVSEYPNFFKLLDQLGTLQKILFWTAFFDIFCAWFYLVLLVWKYVREFLFVCLFVFVCQPGHEWVTSHTLASAAWRIVWQPWRHFVTLVKGRQEHHIRTLALPAPASWGPASISDPFVSWADKHSSVPAAVHCLSLSEEQVLELEPCLHLSTHVCTVSLRWDC